MPYRIFISHSSKDQEWVEEIRSQITATGIEVYIFELDLQPGASLATKLERAISASDAVVAVLTRRGAASAYVHQEIGYAKRSGKLIIPLVEKGAPKRALALLDGVEYIYVDPQDRGRAVTQLTNFLRGKVAKEHENDLRDKIAKRQENDLALALIAVGLILLIAWDGP